MTRSGSNDAYATEAAPGRTDYTVNGLNQIDLLDGSPALDHDGNGNMTSDGSRTYAYSSENLLTSSGAVLYGYDPLMRLSRIDGGGVQAGWRFTRDGGDLVAMHGPGGAEQRMAFGPGTDEPVAWYLPSRGFVHQDERLLRRRGAAQPPRSSERRAKWASMARRMPSAIWRWPSGEWM